MMKLTTNEERVYLKIVTSIIPDMAAGNYFAKDFFGVEPVNPRIVRKIYQEVVKGNIARTSLLGTKSKHGYKIE